MSKLYMKPMSDIVFNQNYKNAIDSANNNSRICKIPFYGALYFRIQNNTYELTIMWCLIITTIILLLSLLAKNANDDVETLRVI
jgi:hypothetical protein